MQKKIYIITIAVLVVITGVLSFRSCLSSDSEGIDTIIKQYEKSKKRVTDIAELLQKSEIISSEIGKAYNSLQSENERLRENSKKLELANTELRESNIELNKIAKNLEHGIDSGEEAIDNIAIGIDNIEEIINTIQDKK